jgi:hypothetical protein
MSKIEWRNVRVKLGDLKPWSENPRNTSKAQAKRLLKSFNEFGQVETIAVGPAFEVYNGHQRLSALLAVYGKDYEVDARQSSRSLTDDERQRLTIYLHAGAVGSWDWDMLSGWDADKLGEWGMDADTLADWRRDTAALTQMIQSGLDSDPMAEEIDSIRDEPGDFNTNRWPLAIVLSLAERREWEDYKRKKGISADKAAFLRLLRESNA